MLHPRIIVAGYALLMSGLLSSCEKPERSVRVDEVPPSAAPPVAKIIPREYPVDHLLRDQQDRTIRALIVGRSVERVYFIRSPDGLKADIPITQLSTQDQAFVHSLPLQPPSGDFFKRNEGPEKPKAKAQPDPTQLYVSAREADIARLEQEKEALMREVNASPNNLQKRNRQTKLEKIETEIARLKAQIQERLDRSR
ncbi:MAG: hypothetical protein KDN18_19655 [Verrucomicrobiae bacterium]|nr:hypothetical protein [Verrucomicrobiae bacterium]